MRTYVATFTHPALAVADLRGFLDREFSLDRLAVERSGGAPFRYRVTFRHPWLEPGTLAGFLTRAYAPGDLSVEASGPGGIARSAAPPEPRPLPPRPKSKRVRDPNRRTLPFTSGHRSAPPRDPAITALFARGTVVSKAELREAAPQLGEVRLNKLLGTLMEAGEIRRVGGRGRYIAADQPDPAPEVIQPERPRRKLQTRSAKAQAIEGAILDLLAREDLAERGQLKAAAATKADVYFDRVLSRLVDTGRVRDLGQGVYQAGNRPAVTPDAVEVFRARQGRVGETRLSHLQRQLLSLLPLEGKVAYGPIAERMGTGPARVGQTVQALGALGLVQVLGHNRSRRVALSETGRAWSEAYPQPDVTRLSVSDAPAPELPLEEPEAPQAREPAAPPKALPPRPAPPEAAASPEAAPVRKASPEVSPVHEARPASRRTGTLRANLARAAAPRAAEPPAFKAPASEPPRRTGTLRAGGRPAAPRILGEVAPEAAKPEALAADPPAERAAPKAASTGSTFTEDLLAYLSEPRAISEITNRLGQSHAAVVGRLEELERAGQIHKRRQGLRFLYCVDPARLPGPPPT